MDTEVSAPFLSTIPVFTAFENVADPSIYRALPSDWWLAVADVVSSEQAIAAGKYKMVNMAGASVITAVLNALGRADYPFVFGGDGAVIAVSGTKVEAARAALAAVARWIIDDLGLQMRVALVPVTDIVAAGHDVQVACLQAGPDLTFSMFSGGGAAWAETEMKAGRYAIAMAAPGTSPDLSGLSCRWNPVKSRFGNILSIIVVPTTGSLDPDFRTLVTDIVSITNRFDGTGNPLPPEGPRPVFGLAGVDAEVRTLDPKINRLRARIGITFQILLSVLLDRTGLKPGGFNMRDYRRDLALNSDFRKFDDGLKMTIDVDDDGLNKIEALLQTAATAGVCKFGTHRQSSALVTCLIPSLMTRDHIHFIDGAAGGYAQAALQMKAKAIPAAGEA